MPPTVIEKARADSFFIFFSLMGIDRSLEKLHSYVTEMGLNISLTSLKRYSAKYNWQERLQEVQTRKVERMEEHVAGDVVEMNINQAKLGYAMQGIAGMGLTLVKKNPAVMSPRDAVHMADIGSKIERLARGEATTRQEITNQLVSPIIYNIVTMFQQVNQIKDPEQREREFAISCDAILEQSVGQLEE
jgi:hypothetical protein